MSINRYFTGFADFIRKRSPLSRASLQDTELWLDFCMMWHTQFHHFPDVRRIYDIARYGRAGTKKRARILARFDEVYFTVNGTPNPLPLFI